MNKFIPDVVDIEEDGDILLEWYKNPRCLVSVSISTDGLISYAALLGEDSIWGTERVPQVIVDLITRMIDS